MKKVYNYCSHACAVFHVSLFFSDLIGDTLSFLFILTQDLGIWLNPGLYYNLLAFLIVECFARPGSNVPYTCTLYMYKRLEALRKFSESNMFFIIETTPKQSLMSGKIADNKTNQYLDRT